MRRVIGIALVVLIALFCAPVESANGIIITFKSSVYSTTNTASTYTASPTWTPTANSLLIAYIFTTYSASPTDPTSVTGHGVSYTKLALGGNTLSTTHKLSIWVALAGGSPTSVACVANVTSTNGTRGGIIEFEVVGADVSGTATNAIQNSGASNTGTSTTPTVTLSAPTLTGNRAMTFLVSLANASPTVSGNWTLTAGAAGSFNTPASGAAAFFNNTVFNTAGAATITNVNWRFLGVEIKSVRQPGLRLGMQRNRIVQGVQ